MVSIRVPILGGVRSGARNLRERRLLKEGDGATRHEVQGYQVKPEPTRETVIAGPESYHGLPLRCLAIRNPLADYTCRDQGGHLLFPLRFARALTHDA